MTKGQFLLWFNVVCLVVSLALWTLATLAGWLGGSVSFVSHVSCASTASR